MRNTGTTSRSDETKWKARPRWRICRGDEIALGPGKVDLLEAIGEAGSISGAARELGMSYRRAWLLVETMNRCFRRPLVATSSFRRGGAAVTGEGQEVLALYRRIQEASLAATRSSWAAIERLLAP
ncbi:MAG TPA: LysR family transcriptional regulator [Thermoanaerobaculia bacterium]|nr:LysR family transcriptional regulator [Thermoanaerobaculia bacterium]